MQAILQRTEQERGLEFLKQILGSCYFWDWEIPAFRSVESTLMVNLDKICIAVPRFDCIAVPSASFSF